MADDDKSGFDPGSCCAGYCCAKTVCSVVLMTSALSMLEKQALATIFMPNSDSHAKQEFIFHCGFKTPDHKKT